MGINAFEKNRAKTSAVLALKLYLPIESVKMSYFVGSGLIVDAKTVVVLALFCSDTFIPITHHIL